MMFALQVDAGNILMSWGLIMSFSSAIKKWVSIQVYMEYYSQIFYNKIFLKESFLMHIFVWKMATTDEDRGAKLLYMDMSIL